MKMLVNLVIMFDKSMGRVYIMRIHVLIFTLDFDIS